MKKSAELDPVKHTAENTRGVLHALLLAELNVFDAEILRAAALILRADRKCASCTCRRLFKDKRDILIFKGMSVDSLFLLSLEIRREIEKISDLLRRKILQREKAAAV